MAPRPSMTSEVHRQLGALAATQQAQADQLERIDATLREDRRAASEDRRLMLAKLDAMADRLPQAGQLDQLETEASNSRLFRSRVGAVVGLMGLAASGLAAGAWYLVTTFWADVLAALARLFGRH